MSKCLVVHTEGENISVHGFNWSKKPEKLSEEEYIYSLTTQHKIHKDKFEGKFFKIIDESELPSRSTRNQWMPCDKNIIRVDEKWEEKLMPCWDIGRKEIFKNEKLISDELGKDTPDELFVFKLKRENDLFKKHIKDSFKNNDQSLFLYEKALSNLDSRVAEGESDKPVIREKLQAKIQELKNANKE